VPQLKAPAGFKGTLRPYQERGLSWLAFLASQGFGGCLADDMGLGKTVQVLALLATRRAKGAPPPRGPDLVVCPTAVVFNWSREANKFTPKLKVHVHQGLGRERDPAAFAKSVEAADVVVTSYAIARRDEALLAAVRWGAVIVDEAQNLTPHEARTIITRAGEGTKIIFTGDIFQIDTPYLDAQSNGLSYLIDRIKGHKLYAHVSLEKGERSELANLASMML
jgi:SNF2 family DNA or RNA helicase